MIPGTFVNGSMAVRTIAVGPAGIATRRGHGARRGLPASAPGGGQGRTGLLPDIATGRAVTVHSPELTPRTSAVIATGPLPGTIPSTVSSCEKVSPDRGFPVTPARRPEK
jgi:hypothetical protein